MSTLTDRRTGLSSALFAKAPVRVATTAEITLSGYQTIDGVLPTSADHITDRRILVKDQSDTSENGIYVMDVGTWARAKDFDGNGDFMQGTMVSVRQGSVSAERIYIISTAIDLDTFQIDTDAIEFVLVTLGMFQALDADLTAIAALANTDGNVIVGNGTTWVAESGNTARTSLGVGTGDSPTFTSATLTFGLNVGFASAPTEDHAKVGDANFGLEYSATVPLIVYDSNDYNVFNRSSNFWDWVIGGSTVVRVQSGSVSFGSTTANTISGLGFKEVSFSFGTVTSGTTTPSAANGNKQHLTNGGAFTLAPPSDSSTIELEITNNGSAGTITTSGFTKVAGDSLTTTNGHKFAVCISKTQNYSYMLVTALQ